MRSGGSRHHFEGKDRKTVDELVVAFLVCLPRKELVLRHASNLWFRHASSLDWHRSMMKHTMRFPSEEPSGS
jgi:hypothetical protein